MLLDKGKRNTVNHKIRRWSGHSTNLVILLHHLLLATRALVNLMHAFFIGTKILLPGLLVAKCPRAIHEPIPTIFIDVSLNMTSRYSFLATLVREWALYSYVVAHIYQ
jgi:hypothetical protein